MTLDVLVVGAGMYGATVAHELTKRGLSCMVVDRRAHIGGNCYTERRDGIDLHMYGAHIFHTNDEDVWKWINQFGAFNQYRHRVKVLAPTGQLLSFPFTLQTFREVWPDVVTAEDAQRRIAADLVPDADPTTLEGHALRTVGRLLYELFIRGYTTKQWGRDPRELPASILKRIPMNFGLQPDYFSDRYQGIPIDGYTALFERILAGIKVETSFEFRAGMEHGAQHVVFSGAIDEYFDRKLGALEYRGLSFVHKRLSGDALPTFQQCAVVNHVTPRYDYTRSIEHRHFMQHDRALRPVTWVTWEYPRTSGGVIEPAYPVRDDRNLDLYMSYEVRARYETAGVTFGGRLGSYRYYDMHQAIGAGLATAERLAAKLRPP